MTASRLQEAADQFADDLTALFQTCVEAWSCQGSVDT